VCSDFYCEAKGVTQTMVKNAVGMARKGNMKIKKRKSTDSTASGFSSEEPFEVTVATEWILKHVVDSGAELIPNSLFVGRSTSDVENARASTNEAAKALKNDCQVRLHERKIRELYNKYVHASRGQLLCAVVMEDSGPDCGFNFEPMTYERFHRVFKEHKKLSTSF